MVEGGPVGEIRHVVTAFLRRQGLILLLRRSGRVGSYRGRWAAVSGHLEGRPALEQALREVEEETGLVRDHLRLVAQGASFVVEDASLACSWTVHPFLFDLDTLAEPKLDWEHDEWRWVRPADLASLATVPRLADGLRACWADAPGLQPESPVD